MKLENVFKEIRKEQGARSRNAGRSGAETVPLLVLCGTKDLEFFAKFNVSEAELVHGLNNISREADEDIRQSMLRILVKHLIATSHK